jgi:hypothetical protein
VVELAQGAVNPHEYFLREILRILVVAGTAAGEADNRGLVMTDQGREGVPIPFCRRRNQIDVRCGI